MSRWTIADIPPQAGKTIVVTGANSGLGYETALELARAGAEVVLASRSETKGQAALERIQGQYAGAKLRFEPLDLASLASVKAFAGRIKDRYAALDTLINNAGVMALPQRQVTADGFEMQFGVNFLGHFALTALLVPLLRKAPKPRVVQLSSIVHKRGQIDLRDLQEVSGYTPWKAYAQSKLAMLMFAMELQRRGDLAGWRMLSTASHPGYANTQLIANGPGATGMLGMFSKLFAPLLSQSAAAGALPTLYAATNPAAKPGGYYGPTGLMELRGAPGPVKLAPQARDANVARKLWEAAETLTGISFKPGP